MAGGDVRVPAVLLLVWVLIGLGCRGGQDSRPTSDAAAPTSAETPSPSPILTTHADLVQNLEHVIEQVVGTDEFSGVVLLSRHGQPLLERAAGLADRERQRTNTVDTPFALASVSKMFTAVVVAQLAEQGLISLSGTIGSLLPDYPGGEASSKVTVHHLLTMSSGIIDLFRSPQFWVDAPRITTSADLWPYFAYAPLEFEPGTKGAYSNSNFVVLGAITERVLGRPFIEIVEERIFRPVGMTSTSYRSRAFPYAAIGYTRRPSGSGSGTSGDSDPWHRAWDDPFPPEGRTAADDPGECLPCTPMGGGYSTAQDLARFAGAVMDGRLLGPDMTRRVLTGYVVANEYPGHEGYGFETRLVGSIRIAGHRGGFRGVANRVEFYPDLGYVLIVLGNTDTDGAETIAAHLRKLVAASPSRPSVGNDFRRSPPMEPTAPNGRERRRGSSRT